MVAGLEERGIDFAELARMVSKPDKARTARCNLHAPGLRLNAIRLIGPRRWHETWCWLGRTVLAGYNMDARSVPGGTASAQGCLPGFRGQVAHEAAGRAEPSKAADREAAAGGREAACTGLARCALRLPDRGNRHSAGTQPVP